MLWLFAASFILASVAVAQSPDLIDPVQIESKPIPDRYIVVFKPAVANAVAEAQRLVRAQGGQVHHTYSNSIKGFAATLPAPAVEALRRNPNVEYVEQDMTVHKWSTTQTNATWGLDRIDQLYGPLDGRYSYTHDGTGVKAYIIDTGIRSSHQDFGGRVIAGATAILDGRGTNDCDGHGTHVAGTVGGSIYGVAKGVTLVPVRVLDCNGSGTWSGVISGVDWVTGEKTKAPGQAMIANMSLGGGASRSVDDAVNRSIAQGVVYAVAAGNDNRDACNYSPARVSAALTVGATDSADRRAGFSNFGSCVNLFAPGVSITSAHSNSDRATATWSGTSMASPHVAGVAALLLSHNPQATPTEVRNAMLSGATAGVVGNPGTRSPNLMLYSRLTDQVVEPPPPEMDPVSIITSSLPRGTVGVEYSAELKATGGDEAYDWRIAEGALPSGLILGNPLVTGAPAVISGIPNQSGSVSVTLEVSSAGTTDRGVFLISIDPAPVTPEPVQDTEAPTVTSMTTSRSTSGPWTRVLVSWAVADNVSLARVDLELLSGTSRVAEATIGVSGTRASGSTELRNRGSVSAVRITVTDEAGNRFTQTQSI